MGKPVGNHWETDGKPEMFTIKKKNVNLPENQKSCRPCGLGIWGARGAPGNKYGETEPMQWVSMGINGYRNANVDGIPIE